MKFFFKGIQYLFENVLFVPLNFFRNLELKNWWAANTISWVFSIICMVAVVYWIKQLGIHKKNNEEDQDTSAHSFL